MKPKKWNALSAAFDAEACSPEHACSLDPDVAICGAPVKYVYRMPFNSVARRPRNVCPECVRLDKQGHPDE